MAQLRLLQTGVQRPGGPAPDRITGSLVEAGGVTLRARGDPAFLGERSPGGCLRTDV